MLGQDKTSLIAIIKYSSNESKLSRLNELLIVTDSISYLPGLSPFGNYPVPRSALDCILSKVEIVEDIQTSKCYVISIDNLASYQSFYRGSLQLGTRLME
jgi:hypothetical protein